MRLVIVWAIACAVAACSSVGKQNARDVTTPAPLSVATGDYPMLGHAPDYAWIAGRVERDIRCTYLRFGSARNTSWGGRIALVASADQLAQLQSGDSVIIKGSLVALAAGACGSPSYVISSIEEH